MNDEFQCTLLQWLINQHKQLSVPHCHTMCRKVVSISLLYVYR